MDFSEPVEDFKGQNFDALYEECIATRKTFVDNEFPPELSSLFSHDPPEELADAIEWKRARVSSGEAEQE